MGCNGKKQSALMIVAAVIMFASGLSAQNSSAGQSTATPSPDGAKSKTMKREDMLPLMKKLPPLPPRKPKKQLAPDAVVVRVNGFDITMDMIDRHTELMATLVKNRSKKIDPEKLKAFRTKNRKRFSDELFIRVLLDTCLAPSNIVVSASMKAKVENDFVRHYGNKGQTLEMIKAVVEKAGCLKDLEAQLALEAKFKTFLTTTCSNRYYVTDAQVEACKKDVQAYNERAAATNEFNLVAAKKMAETVKGGKVDFAKLADLHSQDPEKTPGGCLGEVEESDFADEPHIWRTISRLKPGEVTDALETETGYAIYKVLSVKNPEESTSGTLSFELARIFYRKAFVFPKQTDEEFRSDVENELREKLNRDLIRAFRKQSKIEHPNGVVETP